LTKALAQELPRGMAAIPLSPGVIDTPMLRTAFGEGAAAHESPEGWAKRAAPYILALGPEQSGESLRIPG
jgi:NAD(P)-dependent dehydrogenase (short-subunit alcohol dehydrogenase family)